MEGKVVEALGNSDVVEGWGGIDRGDEVDPLQARK